MPTITKVVIKLLVVMVVLGSVLSSTPTNAAPNPVQLENQQPGSAAWQISLNEATDTVGQIKGYTSASLLLSTSASTQLKPIPSTCFALATTRASAVA